MNTREWTGFAVFATFLVAPASLESGAQFHLSSTSFLLIPLSLTLHCIPLHGTKYRYSVMVEYKRAVDEVDGPSCSMEDISLANGHYPDKFFTAMTDGDDPNVNAVGIRFVNTGVYRSVAKVIGGIDIMYSMLAIGLHLLKLITGFPRHLARLQPNTTAPRGGTEYQQRDTQTVAVVIWVGVFAICVVQVIVAAVLYNGIRKRDGRIVIRNCRIWIFTSLFLVVVVMFQLLGIFIMGNAEEHVFAVCVYFLELVFRTMAIVFIQSFVKELQAEMCDVENGDHVLYYQLCPSPKPPDSTHPISNNNTISV